VQAITVKTNIAHHCRGRHSAAIKIAPTTDSVSPIPNAWRFTTDVVSDVFDVLLVHTVGSNKK
jgi:hypothetical protein